VPLSTGQSVTSASPLLWMSQQDAGRNNLAIVHRRDRREFLFPVTPDSDPGSRTSPQMTQIAQIRKLRNGVICVFGPPCGGFFFRGERLHNLYVKRSRSRIVRPIWLLKPCALRRQTTRSSRFLCYPRQERTALCREVGSRRSHQYLLCSRLSR
jgi:hypothetical protein